MKHLTNRFLAGFNLIGGKSAFSKLEELDFKSGLGDSAWILYGIARSLKPEVCVEIGSARGKSACFIGLALRENGSGCLYAIDPHSPTSWNDSDSVDTFSTINSNINTLGLSRQIEVVRSTSQSAAASWSRPIDLLFIDGDHSYDGVKSDWELFSPHMTEFGIVVFHDTIWDRRSDSTWSRADMGVPRFVDELRTAGYPVITIDKNFGVSLVQPRQGGASLVASTSISK
jgi:predicted O-methyltransferase YrrM